MKDYDFKITGEDHLLFHASGSKHAIRVRNHLTIGSGIEKEKLKERILKSTEKDLRYYMLKWIEKQDSIYPVKNDNWKFIPKKLVEKAKARDYITLFKK